MDTKVVIDLSDPNVRSALTIAIIAWGVGVLVVIYNIVSDLWALNTQKAAKPRPERRFIEPCADGMHTYDDDGDACTTCKQPKESLP